MNTEAELKRVELLEKELKIMATSGFNAKYGGLESILYIRIALSVLKKHPVDMLVFEMQGENRQQCRSAGYFMDGREVNEDNNFGLDETSILWSDESLPTDKFWFKIDDYGDYYVGTFLFPSEY
jgi:hypothetical protein